MAITEKTMRELIRSVEKDDTTSSQKYLMSRMEEMLSDDNLTPEQKEVAKDTQRILRWMNEHKL